MKKLSESNYGSTEEIKKEIEDIKEEINATFLLENPRITALLESSKSLCYEQNVSEDDLENIDKNIYGPLLRRIINENKHDKAEGKILLLNLFRNISELKIKHGDVAKEIVRDTLNKDSKYAKLQLYTDAAVACKYITNIIEKEFYRKEPEREELDKNHDEQIALLKDYAYSTLTSINQEIVQICTGLKLENLSLEKITADNIGEVSNKEKLECLREKASKNLKNLENFPKSQNNYSDYIDQSKKLSDGIAEGMKEYLASLYEKAQDILGDPPCGYTVIGLGSMALKQMTPYSDFEFGILTENDGYKTNKNPKVANYFKYLTHIVQFNMVCLGETVIPGDRYKIDISSFETPAVNFDLGGKTPLGRISGFKPYDLVQTVEGMVKYVKNFKEGSEHIDKILANILEKTCEVYKGQPVHDKSENSLHSDYELAVKSFMEEKSEDNPNLTNAQWRAKHILVEGVVEKDYSKDTPTDKHIPGYLEQFSPDLQNSIGELFNVKQEIYRLPDRFIDSLGKLCKVIDNGAWNIVEKLLKDEIINETAALNFKKATSFAIALRNKTYCENKCQSEKIPFHNSADGINSEESAEIFGLSKEDIAEDGILFKFFYSMIPLHKKLSEYYESLEKGEDVDIKTYFKEENFYQNDDNTKAEICSRLLQWDNALRFYDNALQNAEDGSEEEINILNKIGTIYRYKGKPVDALESYKEALSKEENPKEQSSSVGGKSPMYLTLLKNIGDTYIELGNYDTALKIFLSILETVLEPDSGDNKVITGILKSISQVYHNTGDHKAALDYLVQNGQILKDEGVDTAANLSNVGNQYYHLGHYEMALHYQELALQMRKDLLVADHPDIIANINDINETHKKLNGTDTSKESSEEMNEKLAHQQLSQTNHDISKEKECKIIAGIESKYEDWDDKKVKEEIDKNIKTYLGTLTDKKQPSFRDSSDIVVQELDNEQDDKQTANDNIDQEKNYTIAQYRQNESIDNKITEYIQDEIIDCEWPDREAEKGPLITIDKFIKNKENIRKKAQELNIEIIGTFGKIAKTGKLIEGDKLGILVRALDDKKEAQLEAFQKWMTEKFKCKIKITNEKDLVSLKENTSKTDTKDFLESFLETAKKSSLEHLENCITLSELVKNLYGDFSNLNNQINEIINFTETKKIAFALNCEFFSTQPILHALCTLYFDKDKPDELLGLIKLILEKDKDAIGYYSSHGSTILHVISEYGEYDKPLYDCIEDYISFEACNKVGWGNTNPMLGAMLGAIEKCNTQLIELLKDKIDLNKYGESVLIHAVKYGNEELLQYLILQGVNCEVYDEFDRPNIIHHAIFEASSTDNPYSGRKKGSQFSDQHREVVKILLSNGAKVMTLNGKAPIQWALEKKDIELALLLAENFIGQWGGHYSGMDDYSIHLAIKNLKDCDQRDDYLKLISKIVQKEAGNKYALNQEYHGTDTPLYLAARQGETKVMEILLENGATVNYKNHRFSRLLSEVKDIEVIKTFVKYGYWMDYEHCAKNCANRKDIDQEFKDYFDNYSKLFSMCYFTEKLQNFVKEQELGSRILKELSELMERGELYCNSDDLSRLKSFIKRKSLDLNELEELKWLAEKDSLRLGSLVSMKEFAIKNPLDADELKALKEFSKENSLDLNACNKHGKNLFCYALAGKDLELIKYLADEGAISTEAKFLDPRKRNALCITDYHDYISRLGRLNGDILKILNDHGLIEWKKFDEISIRNMTNLAQKATDSKLICLFQKYMPRYNDILEFSYSVKKDEVIDKKLLETALKFDDSQFVISLIKEGKIHINFSDDNHSLLDKALNRGSNKIVRYLIENSALSSNGDAFPIDKVLYLDAETKEIILQYIKNTPQIFNKVMSEAKYFLDDVSTVEMLLDLGWRPGYVYEDNYYSTGFAKCAKNEGWNDTLEYLLDKAIENDFHVDFPVLMSEAIDNCNYEGGWILLEHAAHFKGQDLLNTEQKKKLNKYYGVLLVRALQEGDINHLNLLLEMDPEIIKRTNNLDKDKYLSFHISYNPSILSHQGASDSDAVLKKDIDKAPQRLKELKPGDYELTASEDIYTNASNLITDNLDSHLIGDTSSSDDV